MTRDEKQTGKPRKRKGRTDYLLCIPIIDGKSPLPVALLEAKAEDKLPSLEIRQAKDYMKRFNVPFIFSTNGNLYTDYAEDTEALPGASCVKSLNLKRFGRTKYVLF